MKKQLFTAIAVLASFCGYAQTKGTNALGLGVSLTSNKTNGTSGTGTSEEQQKNTYLTLGYGHFISDNTKLGLDLLYLHNKSTSDNESQNNTTNGFGGALSYQKYFLLTGKLYAYAGGTAGYARTKLTYDDPANENQVVNDAYHAGAYGGITWFVGRRWAFETRLLSATATFSSTDQTNGSGSPVVYRNRQSNFDLSTDGIINDLGFKIYLLF